ncbi:hypothetical protein A2797_02175 [candidate division WWE3 bacterium RIFCSPHIGHO2_01_FULL_48_15]|uniref:DUF86 domain-containing protein n=1 Tax=candidate division WWE3 bacterium RIFCSPHIGHO2_01_FULL_48_15 TaxID=1802619 RepID=A0A1F4VGR8_UNCKA|nr:MAG: hypothetical protein A2797_02175 [candidate division WWE3 bacterium RIFCSPHIGHO2_01_FULL_48_15]
MFLGLFGGNKSSERGRRATTGFLKPYDKARITSEWGRIEQLVSAGSPSAIKEAVLAADKLLDYALAQISSGETMGERLKNSFSAFPRDVYQGLWDAHKARNAMVHEINYDLSVLMAKEVLGKFKRGFMALGASLSN